MASRKKIPMPAVAQPALLSVTVPMPTDPQMMQAAQAFLTQVDQFAVATSDDYVLAAEILKRLNAKDAEIEAQRKFLKGPIDQAAARIQGLFNPPIQTLERARNIIKRKMSTWHQAQEAKRRKAQADAAELLRKEQQKLLDQAKKAEGKGKIEHAQVLEQRAVMLVAAPVFVESAPKVAGVSMRDYWTYEVTDASLLPREYLSPNLSAIAQVVKALKENTNIPGVRAFNDPKPAAGAG